jgi:hypothetical protein
LEKEVLHRTDLEEIIGKRPFATDVAPSDSAYSPVDSGSPASEI